MPLKVSTAPKLFAKLEPLTQEHLDDGPVLVCLSTEVRPRLDVYLASRSARVHDNGLRPWRFGDQVYADLTSLTGNDTGHTCYGQNVGAYHVLPKGYEITVTLSNSN